MPNVKISWTLDHIRETKGSHLYKDTGGRVNFYLPKDNLQGLPTPKKITLTVEEWEGTK